MVEVKLFCNKFFYTKIIQFDIIIISVMNRSGLLPLWADMEERQSGVLHGLRAPRPEFIIIHLKGKSGRGRPPLNFVAIVTEFSPSRADDSVRRHYIELLKTKRLGLAGKNITEN